jgi:hypothetical protein
MAEEHITTVEPREGGATHTTIISDGERRGSGAGWLIAVILIVALIAGIFIFSGTTGSEVAKDNAIANAANQVGDAAQQAGNAAQDAADNLKQ